MRRAPGRGLLPLLAVVLGVAACGGDEDGRVHEPSRTSTVAGLSAGYLPEGRAVRVGWLPVERTDTGGYEVFRAGPFELSDPVSGPISEKTSIGTITDTTFDDEDVAVGEQYAYAVSIRFADGSTGPVSEWATAPVPGSGSTGATGATQFADLCAAADNAPALDQVLLQPADTARPNPTGDPALNISGFLTESDSVTITWSKAVVDGGTEGIGCPPVGRGLDLDCSEVAVKLSDPNESCTGLDAALDDPDTYAIVAQLTGVAEGYNSKVFFPYDDADERVRLRNVSPTPASVLRLGGHQFKADIDYAVDSLTGVRLTAFVIARLENGTDRVLDADTFDLEQNSGSVLYANGVTLPSDAVNVRLIARFGRGSVASTYIEDEIYYAIVP